VGLSYKPRKAAAFHSVLAIAGLLGIGLNFTAVDPIAALYWSAVINGVLAAPVMALLMILVRKPKVMGSSRDGFAGSAGQSTVAMALCIAGMAASMFMRGP
jgi:Mn2+/Fe2+ NRAMP family transporter